MKNRLSLFRALIPSWGFFDDFGEGFDAMIRFARDQESLSDWQRLFSPQPRRWTGLVFNPSGNERLLAVATFERLLSEAQDHLAQPDLLANTATYKICERLARERVPPTAAIFQFKITSATGEDVFVSKAHSS